MAKKQRRQSWKRRFNVCCPDKSCGGFQEAMRLLTSHGVEPKLGVDRDGDHYLEFTVPSAWTCSRKRILNGALAKKLSVDTRPCEACGSVMWHQAFSAQCKECDRIMFVCDECIGTNSAGSFLRHPHTEEKPTTSSPTEY